jgi:carboxyl-terminal processing protease
MKRNRIALLVTSAVVLVLIAGGGLAVRVGATDSSYRQVVRFSEVLSLVVENYVDPVESDALLEGAYEGMLNGLDASGTFLTPAEVKDWMESPGSAEADPGLAVVKVFGALQVVRVAKGSPAEAAEIEAGDQIRHLDGQPLRDLSLEQAIRRLKGKSGTSVALGILRAKAGIEREEIDLKRSSRSEAPFALDAGPTAVLKVFDLSRVQRKDLAEALATLRGKEVKRLLIDLRDVVEGSPRDAMQLLSLFVSGDTLRLKERSGKVVETLSSESAADAWSGPIAVLVNGVTASGAEAVARVLHDRRSAAVYGEATLGRAAEPKLFRLSNGSGLLLPAQLWETVAGESWQDDGIQPDVTVAVTTRSAETAADQLRRALEAFEAKDKETAAAKPAA